MIGRKYVEETEQKVYGIYESDVGRTNYIGRILVDKYGVLVMKKEDRIFLHWDEVRILSTMIPPE